MTAEEVGEDSTVKATHRLPFAFSMILPAFRGAPAVAGIEGLTNPRGFIVIEKRGRVLLWSGIVVASVVFAALHQHLWKWEGGWPWADGHLLWTPGLKGWFTTGMLFLGSLWFYFVRFASFNPQRSLLPCFAAHAAKNAGVIAVKAAQGHLVGWW